MHMLKSFLVLLGLFAFQFNIVAQERYEISTIGFYNLENLFDLVDDSLTRDDDFTPDGKLRYTKEVYETKLKNLAEVISELGTDKNPDGIALLGVSEIENRYVLEDLIKEQPLRKRNFQIVHYDSPDKRGVDVGMLYNPRFFTYISSESLLVNHVTNGDTLFTRDVLYVQGILRGDTVDVFVNHWPSRSGGEKRSEPKRIAAAQTVRAAIDTILMERPQAKILVMGDLNDDPINASIADHLGAVGKLEELKGSRDLFNPMWKSYKKGNGSNSYRDSWSLFDQIIVSEGLIETQDGLRYHDYKIYKPKKLQQASGRFKGYPKRTYSNGQFIGGYSDHYPVYVHLIKAKK